MIQSGKLKKTLIALLALLIMVSTAAQANPYWPSLQAGTLQRGCRRSAMFPAMAITCLIPMTPKELFSTTSVC